MLNKRLIPKKLISLATTIAICTTLATNVAFAETGNKTFVSEYGGNLDSSDVTDFRDKFISYGFSGYAITKASYNNMKWASSSNVLYWSGHGLPSGIMSYWESDTEYVNYNDPSNTTPMHARVGATYTKYNSTDGYYSNSEWNGSLNWVVMASCRQLSEPSNRNSWAMTMAAPHRVKGFMGYTGVAPDGLDNAIAKKFADLCFTSVSKRPLYAWIEANKSVGYKGAASLYHTINKNDTLTSITDNDKFRVPTYEMMTQAGSTITDPFNGDPIYTAMASMSLASTASLSEIGVPDVAADEIEISDVEKSNFSEDKKANRKYSSVKMDISNYADVVEKVNKALRDSVVPQDAVLREVIPLNTTKVEETTGQISGISKTTGYILSYGRKLNGIGVATNYLGDYINVFVDEDGIYSIDKQWSKLNVSESKKNNVPHTVFKNPELVNNAVAYATKQILASGNTLPAEVKDKVCVYAKDKKAINKLVPALEVSFENYDGLVYVDALTGEILN